MFDTSKPYILHMPCGKKIPNVPPGHTLVYSKSLVIPDPPVDLLFELFAKLEEIQLAQIKKKTYEKWFTLRMNIVDLNRSFAEYISSQDAIIEFMMSEIVQPMLPPNADASMFEDTLRNPMNYLEGILENISSLDANSDELDPENLHVHSLTKRNGLEIYWSPDKSTVRGVGYFTTRKYEDGFNWAQPAVDNDDRELGLAFDLPPGSLIIGTGTTGVHGWPYLDSEQLKSFNGKRRAMFATFQVKPWIERQLVDMLVGAYILSGDNADKVFVQGLSEIGRLRDSDVIIPQIEALSRLDF